MVTVRLANPGDAAGIEQVLAASGLGHELADQGHYVRFVASDEDGALLGFIDGLFDFPVPGRAAAGAPPGPQAWATG